MLPDRVVRDLHETYQRLARPWTPDQLAEHYHVAEGRGEQLRDDGDGTLNRPIAVLAAAIPPAASLNVAIHVFHALPQRANGDLAEQLLATAETNVANTLHRCHTALRLDGAAHDYTPDEWLPVVYDTALPLLDSAQLDQEPPSVVHHAQDAMLWLSAAIANLDLDSPDAPAALADALARVLCVHIFAEVARDPVRPA